MSTDPTTESHATTLEPFTTAAPWHYTKDSDGSYHLGSDALGLHLCIGFLHSAFDAALICALRNSAAAAARAASAPPDALDPCAICKAPLGGAPVLARGAGDYVHDDCREAGEHRSPELMEAFQRRHSRPGLVEELTEAVRASDRLAEAERARDDADEIRGGGYG